MANPNPAASNDPHEQLADDAVAELQEPVTDTSITLGDLLTLGVVALSIIAVVLIALAIVKYW